MDGATEKVLPACGFLIALLFLTRSIIIIAFAAFGHVKFTVNAERLRSQGRITEILSL
jgi:hypothetical protein